VLVPDERLGAALKQLREEAGLTQRELARRTGLGQSQIAKIELAMQPVRVTEFLTWCRACRVKPSEVIAKLDP
jgi:transcriptional regulator with XRE-family HTH domain